VTYSVVFREQAPKALQQLDKPVRAPVRARIGKVIDRLAENPRPAQATQLVGDPLTWRVRAGDWRVLYQIHEDRLVVLILDLGHRSRVYGGR
jgi:mRNA interferase RelE/StbE